MVQISAVLPLIEKDKEGNTLPKSTFEQIVSSFHPIYKIEDKKVGRGHKNLFIPLGECKASIKGKLIYVLGTINNKEEIPGNCKYLSLLITQENIVVGFAFTENSDVVSKPNYTLKEVK